MKICAGKSASDAPKRGAETTAHVEDTRHCRVADIETTKDLAVHLFEHPSSIQRIHAGAIVAEVHVEIWARAV